MQLYIGVSNLISQGHVVATCVEIFERKKLPYAEIGTSFQQ